MTGSVSFDRVAADYDRTRGGEERGERYAAVLDPLFSRRGLTLEVGVGTGVVARGLRALRRRVVGVDLSPLMLARARERIGSSVAVGDALRLPLRTGTVDDAYSVWVLHLVGDVGAVLAEVARVLRPAGRYLVVTSAKRETDPIGQVLAGVAERLQGERRARDRRDNLVLLGASVGLVPVVSQLDQEEFTFPESPSGAAAWLEQRSASFVWEATEDQWREVVVPALERLRSMPEPDTPIERRVVHDVVVLERLKD